MTYFSGFVNESAYVAGFLINILATSAGGYPCLLLLRHRFWEELLLLWGLLGVLKGKRFQLALVPLHTQTHILHTPVSIWGFREIKSSCFPLHRKAKIPGIKGHYARPSAQALPVFNFIVNTPLTHALLPAPMLETIQRCVTRCFQPENSRASWHLFQSGSEFLIGGTQKGLRETGILAQSLTSVWIWQITWLLRTFSPYENGANSTYPIKLL